MNRSIGRLYQSVDGISASYLQPGKSRSDLLQPKVLHADGQELLLLQGGGSEKSSSSSPPLARFKLFTCTDHCSTATMEAKTACPQCQQAMATEVVFVAPSAAPKGVAAFSASSGSAGDETGGYVKGLVTYMVTDGLEVTPMSAISSITLINMFSVGNSDVELAEKYVTVGMDEGLGLLKAALRSDTVLSDVFMA